MRIFGMESLEMTTKKQLIDVRNVYSLFIKNGTASLHVADIDLIPRVDAVEVVRCKDCKHYDKRYALTPGGVWCAYWGVDPLADDFCSYGERRCDNEAD
jgi:hypothetical protein